jgi:hypothetical protein
MKHLSRLQRSEIHLKDVREDKIVIEPTGDTYNRPRRSVIALRFPGPPAVLLSPEEAHTIGSALVEHALECGYDPGTGETKPVE